MKLVVNFDGLCHFVPVYETDPPADLNRPQKVWALLVNARTPDSLNILEITEDDRKELNSHLAFVRYSLGHALPEAPADAFGAWSLHGMDLQILDARGNPLGQGAMTLKEVKLNDPAKPRIGTEEESSFHWVINVAATHNGRVDPVCLHSNPSSVPPDRVAARVELLGGELSTGLVVTREGTAEPLLFALENSPPQALSQQVRLTVEVPTEDGVILTRRTRATGVVQRLPLRPIDGRIEISVANLEPAKILDPAVKAPHPPRDDGKIIEFFWFSKLFASQGQPFSIPAMTQGLLDSDPHCPNASSYP